MISAVLLLTIGALDAVLGLVKLRRRTRAGLPADIWGAGAAALAVPLAGWLALGTPPIWAVVVAACGVLWLWAETRFLRRLGHIPFLTAAIASVPVVALAVLAERTTVDDSPAAQAFSGAMSTARLPLSLPLVVAVVAAALVLTRTANVVCRAAFGRAMTTDRPAAPGATGPRRWSLSLGERPVASLVEDPPLSPGPPLAGSALRGGRVIGPLERILIVALALAGAEAVIVGLVAAKGIVRFPEISADGRGGSKAEEFLIGSLVSWTIAGLVAAYLAVQRIS